MSTAAPKHGSNGNHKFEILVIGCGNELRGDDAVGPKTAAMVAQWNLPGIRTMVCRQFSPDLAVPIAASRRVVFIDSAVKKSSSVSLREVQPENPKTANPTPDPRTLLRLANEIFGRAPAAFWLTIPVESVRVGGTLSPRARDGMQSALAKIRTLTGA
jgi:hydrogenase maturation protease